AFSKAFSLDETVFQKPERREGETTLVTIRVGDFSWLKYAVVVGRKYCESSCVRDAYREQLIFIVCNKVSMSRWIQRFIVKGIQNFKNQTTSLACWVRLKVVPAPLFVYKIPFWIARISATLVEGI